MKNNELTYQLLIKYLVIFSLTLYSEYGYSQGLSRITGQILVEFSLDYGSVPNSIVVDYKGTSLELLPVRMLSKAKNYWLFKFNETTLNANLLKLAIENHHLVRSTQFDFLLKSRSTYPNDPLYSSQWAWLDENTFGTGYIAIPEAWDITTGGVSSQGDTIVLAMVDDGIDLFHQDLTGNLWKNYNEIPNNGIDDDDNGFVDDFNGWNAIASIDYVGFGFHGAHVAGILGAKGNNDLGISGINWDIKIMPIVGQSMIVSEIIEGYDYALQQRILWNQSNGDLGAFVVAVNTSWGIDNGWASDAPLWCEFYNTLGEAGIISCSAVSNNNYNIDNLGDLPGTCPSEYQITVTATDIFDNREFAAYGLEHVDLSAPGYNILTTEFGNIYGYASGTSFAAPVLTGLVGLLYASPCENLVALAKNDPSSAAYYVKNAILNNVDEVNTLQLEVSSGGRVNALQPMNEIVSNCPTCLSPYQIEVLAIGLDSIEVKWEVFNSDSIDLFFKETSAIEWDTSFNVSSGFGISNLQSCTNYELILVSYCDSGPSQNSPLILFETEGCCYPPTDISILHTSAAVEISWDSVVNATSYLLQYRKMGSQVWTDYFCLSNYHLLTDLDDCYVYEARIENICPGIPSEYSEVFYFSSENCATCNELTYCDSEGNNALSEWIESVKLNNSTSESGNDTGYGSFTDGLRFESIVPGQVNTMLVLFGYSNIVFNEFLTVWIDYNQDGVFETSEIINSDHLNDITDSVSFDFIVPNTSLYGITRMRIAMQYDNFSGPCGFFDYGEVEDYCINITSPLSDCFNEIIVDTTVINTNSVALVWSENLSIEEYKIHWHEKGCPSCADSLIVSDNFAIIENLKDCQEYDFHIMANCGFIHNTSLTYTYRTDCVVGTIENSKDLDIKIFPSPFYSQLTIQSSYVINEVTIYSANGKTLLNQQFDAFLKQIHLNNLALKTWSKGVYIIKIKTDHGVATQKLLHL